MSIFEHKLAQVPFPGRLMIVSFSGLFRTDFIAKPVDLPAKTPVQERSLIL